MTGTDADGIPSNDGDAIAMLYDKIAENERLQLQVDLLTLTASIAARQYDRQISLQQVRIVELEAEIAVMRGTLSRHDAIDDDQPAVIHYDVEPNAPR